LHGRQGNRGVHVVGRTHDDGVNFSGLFFQHLPVVSVVAGLRAIFPGRPWPAGRPRRTAQQCCRIIVPD
jgi:hypothetical protein